MDMICTLWGCLCEHKFRQRRLFGKNVAQSILVDSGYQLIGGRSYRAVRNKDIVQAIWRTDRESRTEMKEARSRRVLCSRGEAMNAKALDLTEWALAAKRELSEKERGSEWWRQKTRRVCSRNGMSGAVAVGSNSEPHSSSLPLRSSVQQTAGLGPTADVIDKSTLLDPFQFTSQTVRWERRYSSIFCQSDRTDAPPQLQLIAFLIYHMSSCDQIYHDELPNRTLISSMRD